MDESSELAKVLNKLGEVDVNFDKVADILNDDTIEEHEKVDLLKQMLPKSKRS